VVYLKTLNLSPQFQPVNFLAHAYLSGSDPEVLFGNFVADGIKGTTAEAYPPGIKKGIVLHRAIDQYTDSHVVVKQSVSRLQPVFHKYAVVIVDIYFDHFLARYWQEYSQEDLVDFSQKVYETLISRYRWLPPRTKRALPFMIAQNWLVGYANLRDLDRVFRGMSRRSRFDSGMEKAVGFLQLHYADFESDFRNFFPQLVAFCGPLKEDI
jgi:acyl carrier protein phosphodiesterase